MWVRLQTKTLGGTLVDVERITIPPFQTEPEVIIWGNRVFARSGSGQGPGDERPVHIYVEVFAYVVPG